MSTHTEIGCRIKSRRKDLGLTLTDIANEVGVAASTIQRYEKGRFDKIKIPVIEAIAAALHVNPEWLIGNTDDPVDYDDPELIASIPRSYIELCNGNVEQAFKVMQSVDQEAMAESPRAKAGKVTAANFPDNILPLPKTYRVPLIGDIACGAPILAVESVENTIEVPEHVKADFALRCKGDSMINARVFDGDIVYIRKQDAVDDGEIAAVLIDDEATLKRVRLYSDHISLEPENPQYRPLVYWESDMNKVRILGRAVAFTSHIK